MNYSFHPVIFIIFDQINSEAMQIERTTDEILIRIPSYVDTQGLQRLIDFLIYREATSKSKAKQSDVDELAAEVKKGWWDNNRSRFIK